MAADPRGPGDPLEQLRADRERQRAEERADAPSSSAPPPDWHHDTLELDLDGLRHEAAGPPPVVDGRVLRSRTHGGGWRAVRQGSSAAVTRARRVRVPAGLVVGLVLVVGAGATSAALDSSGSGPQTSPQQTTTTSTGTGTTQGGATTAGDQPQGSVRVETGGSDAGRAPEQDAGPPPDPQAVSAAGGPGGPGAPVDPATGPGGGGPAGGPGSGPAAGPGAGPAGAPGRP